MKKLKLIALSLAGIARSGYRTANAVADDVAALKKQLDELQKQNAELTEKVEASQVTAASVVADELDLGGLRLPEGLDKKDVLWRLRAGLDLHQAVAAAIAQKKHDDAIAAAKVAEKKK